MDSNLRTLNSELRTIFQRKNSLDEIFSQLVRGDLHAQKILFRGERVGEISSYVAGWLASKGIEVIVLDGANRFDPYMVSSFARKALIPPERLLKRIRIARAFTCYQMAVMVGERLISLVGAIHESPLQKPWVILLGPVTPFMDEDVSEREARPLFERSLKKIEEMVLKGIPFLLFQPNPPFPPFSKGGVGGLMDSKRTYLMRRLFQFSNEVWRISLEDEEAKGILEKNVADSKWLMADRKNQMTSTDNIKTARTL